MTNTYNSMIRTARGLFAGLTFGLTVAALTAAPAGTASADGYDTWRTNYGCCHATVDAADYVVWRKTDGTQPIGDTVTFTYIVTNPG